MQNIRTNKTTGQHLHRLYKKSILPKGKDDAIAATDQYIRQVIAIASSPRVSALYQFFAA